MKPKEIGSNEVCKVWYSCSECDCIGILREDNYCPRCGAKIEWDEPTSHKKIKIFVVQCLYSYEDDMIHPPATSFIAEEAAEKFIKDNSPPNDYYWALWEVDLEDT